METSEKDRKRFWHRRLIKTVTRVGIGLMIAYGLWLTYLGLAQESLIFAGAYFIPTPDGLPPTQVRTTWLDLGTDARVEAWFAPGAGRSASSPGPAVIFFHGNDDLVDEKWHVVTNYLPRGISVLAAEYPGYGRSTGEPSEQTLVASAVAGYDWLVQQPVVDPARIVLHGNSLGGGVAVALAAQRPAAALILESTFVSLDALSHRFLALPGMCRHPFRNDLILPRLQMPVLIVHGRSDLMIPVEHGRRLHALTPGSDYAEHDRGHANYVPQWQAIFPFLNRCGLLPQEAASRPAPLGGPR